jgi:hypothetical protein
VEWVVARGTSEYQSPLGLVPRDSVLGNLNKLAKGNYPVILKKIREVLCDANIRASINRILSKAYKEPDSTVLCMNMIRDIHSGLEEDGRVAAVGAVGADVSDTVLHLRERVLLPATDPAKDYGKFCDVNIAKRSAVGRSRALYPFLRRDALPGLSSRFGADEFFTTHVHLLGDLVREAAAAGACSEALTGEDSPALTGEDSPALLGEDSPALLPAALPSRPEVCDVLAAVEVLLDCCEAMVAENREKRKELREMVRSVGGAKAFPSIRSRFKVADIISGAGCARGARTAA